VVRELWDVAEGRVAGVRVPVRVVEVLVFGFGLRVASDHLLVHLVLAVHVSLVGVVVRGEAAGEALGYGGGEERWEAILGFVGGGRRRLEEVVVFERFRRWKPEVMLARLRPPVVLRGLGC